MPGISWIYLHESRVFSDVLGIYFIKKHKSSMIYHLLENRSGKFSNVTSKCHFIHCEVFYLGLLNRQNLIFRDGSHPSIFGQYKAWLDKFQISFWEAKESSARQKHVCDRHWCVEVSDLLIRIVNIYQIRDILSTNYV